jgi:hypothetical protein
MIDHKDKFQNSQDRQPTDLTNAPSDLRDAYISYFHYSVARNEYYRRPEYYAIDDFDFFSEWWYRASATERKSCTDRWSSGFNSPQSGWNR